MNILDFRNAVISIQQNISQTADVIWYGLGSTNNWSMPTNWIANRIPTNGRNLIFRGSNRLTPVNDIASLTVNNITFAAEAGSFSISGNSISRPNNSYIVNESSSPQIISNNMVLGTGIVGGVFNCSSAPITVNGNISGLNAIIKTGPEVLTLGGVNTHSRNTYINQGTIKLGNVLGVGTTGTEVFFAAGATLDLNGVGQESFVAYVSNTFGAGTITNTSNVTSRLVSGRNGTFSGNIDQTNGLISIIKSSIGYQIFSGSNNSTGEIQANAGVLELYQILDSSVGPIVFRTVNQVPTFRYNGSTPASIVNRSISLQGLSGTATIDNFGTGTLSLGNISTSVNSTGQSGTKTLVLSGTNADNNSVGVVSNGLNTLSIVKAGTGKWSFRSQANTYTGSTSITDGTLISTKGTATAEFTANSLRVIFSTAPSPGNIFRFFPGSTVQQYTSISLVDSSGVTLPGLTATYTQLTSTLTIA